MLGGIIACGRALAVAVLGYREYVYILVVAVYDKHLDHLVPLSERDAFHADRHPPHRPYIRFRKAHGLAVVGEQHQVRAAICDGRADQAIVLGALQCDDAIAPHVLVGAEGGLLDDAVAGRCHEVALVEVAYGYDRPYRVVLELNVVDQGPAASHAIGFGQAKHLEPMADTSGGQEEECGVGRCNEEMLHMVVVLRRHAGHPAPTPPLGAELREGRALGVAPGRHRDDDILIGYEVLNLDIGLIMYNVGAPVVAESSLQIL